MTTTYETDGLARPEAAAIIRDAKEVLHWFEDWKRNEYHKSGRVEMECAIEDLARTIGHVTPVEG